jgi:hypothetical protein
VFEIWDSIAPDAPIPVMPCRRYFVSLKEAAALTLWTSVLPPGRYTIDPGEPRLMEDIAAELFPGRTLERIPARRGDRIVEPRHAASEQVEPVFGVIELVSSPHDAQRAPALPQSIAA